MRCAPAARRNSSSRSPRLVDETDDVPLSAVSGIAKRNDFPNLFDHCVDIVLEGQLKASFPKPGDEPVIRKMVTDDIGKDQLGIYTRKIDGQIVYTVPIAVYVGRKS
jgi:hypothetical protein